MHCILKRKLWFCTFPWVNWMKKMCKIKFSSLVSRKMKLMISYLTLQQTVIIYFVKSHVRSISSFMYHTILFKKMGHWIKYIFMDFTIFCRRPRVCQEAFNSSSRHLKFKVKFCLLYFYTKRVIYYKVNGVNPTQLTKQI